MKKAVKWFEGETSRFVFRIGKNILTVSGKRMEWSAWSLQPLDFSMIFFFKTENSKGLIAERQLSREGTVFHPAVGCLGGQTFLS